MCSHSYMNPHVESTFVCHVGSWMFVKDYTSPRELFIWERENSINMNTPYLHHQTLRFPIGNWYLKEFQELGLPIGTGTCPRRSSSPDSIGGNSFFGLKIERCTENIQLQFSTFHFLAFFATYTQSDIFIIFSSQISLLAFASEPKLKV